MTLKELFNILIKKWYIILSVTVIFALGGVLISKTLITKKYASESRAYVTAEYLDDKNTSAKLMDVKIAAIHGVNLATSSEIYSKLSKQLSEKNIGDFSPTSLKDGLKVFLTNKDLNVISMTCKWTDPKLACAILKEFNLVLASSLADLPFDSQYINMVVAEQPRIDEVAIYPNVLMNTILSIFLGFIISIAIIIIMGVTNTKIKTADDVKVKLSTILLSEIPSVVNKVTDKSSQQKKSPFSNCPKLRKLFGIKTEESVKSSTLLITDDSAPFGFKESYNNLAVSLVYSVTKSSGKTICVTSAQPDSGKSSVSINLSLTLAQMGNKVLIVDCDLRKPVFCRYFKALDSSIDPNHIGITDVLFNNQSYENAVSVNVLYNLTVLYSGTLPPNPQTVLLSAKFKELISEKSKEYDWIILDTPPINLVSDAVIINEICDNSILVTKSNLDEIKDITEAKSKLGHNYLGIALIGDRNKSYNRSQYRHETVTAMTDKGKQ